MAYPTVSQFLVTCFHLLLCGNQFQSICAAQNHTSGLSIHLIHRHSPESPMYEANLTDQQRMEELIQISNFRVKSLASTLGTKNSPSRSPHLDIVVRPSFSSKAYQYFVNLGVGTFNSNPLYKLNYLIIDTGSDLIWMQCEGCKKCFHQVGPYFPKSQSGSYKQYSCYPRCLPQTICRDDTCIISRSYEDGARLEALAAEETFSFESEGGKYTKIENVFFGCGVNMENFTAEERNRKNVISGILGLDYGDYSFVTQTREYFEGRFSYCLQPYKRGKGGSTSSPMFLRFGDDVPQTTGMLSTPLRQVKNRYHYYLNLTGLYVSKNKLNIPPETFMVLEDGSGGCLIDTGSTVSYLITPAYKIFAAAVSIFMESMNPNLRKMKPEAYFQLCFERFMEPETVLVPSVTFVFENAEFYVEPQNAFFIGLNKAGEAMICSTIFESAYGETILGSYQQVDKRIIYDTQNGQLFFKQEDCSAAN